MTETASHPQNVNPPSFETVWAIMQENALQLKEIDRIVKETAVRQKKTERQMKETDKQLGRLGRRFGETIEYMVQPNLIQRFREIGLEFNKIYPRADIEDRVNKIYAEIDITLENGDKVMIVEVKSKPSTEDVTEHIERMEKVRQHGDLRGDKRAFLGAIAGMIVKDNVKQFALKTGFYVIEPSGETFTITAPEGEYSPREW
jgi:CBS domain-containing protein